jgi:hypothetical protein
MKNWIVGLILLVLAAAGFYFFKYHQPVESIVPEQPSAEMAEQAMPEPEPAPVVTVPEAETAVENEKLATEPAAVEEVPLPMLAESDPVAFEAAGQLIGEEAASELLASDNLISRLVTTVDALGGRQIPGTLQAVREPAGNFAAVPDDEPDTIIRNEEGDPIAQFTLDPANYQRYTPYVEIFEAMDTAQLLESFDRNYALAQEAYRMQGYPQGEFNERLIAVIDELLATPQVSDPVQLVKPEAYFLFADPELESLTAGQKILVRMGNPNAERVKTKLMEIRAALLRR